MRFFLKKFTDRLLRVHVNNVLLFPKSSVRLLMGPSHCFQFAAKLTRKKSLAAAGQTLFGLFQELAPGLICNNAIDRAAKYRRYVRRLQRNWISKYNSRLKILENFAKRHVKEMVKEYPHLRLVERRFFEGSHDHEVVYNYLQD